MHAMRLKIRGSHLRCKVAYKTLKVRAQVEVLKTYKDSLPFPLLSRESSVSVKENQIEKIYTRVARNILYFLDNFK